MSACCCCQKLERRAGDFASALELEISACDYQFLGIRPLLPKEKCGKLPRRDHRAEVLGFLRYVAYGESSAATEGVRQADADFALKVCALWFDQIFVPGVSYFDGIKGDEVHGDEVKGDRSEADVELFNSCFSAGELEALERFHRFFELRVKVRKKGGTREFSRRESNLNESNWGAGELFKSNFWGYLAKDARAALSAFAADFSIESGSSEES